MGLLVGVRFYRVLGMVYSFNFEWLSEKNLDNSERNDGTPSWCQVLQSAGKSCYNSKH